MCSQPLITAHHQVSITPSKVPNAFPPVVLFSKKSFPSAVNKVLSDEVLLDTTDDNNSANSSTSEPLTSRDKTHTVAVVGQKNTEIRNQNTSDSSTIISINYVYVILKPCKNKQAA